MGKFKDALDTAKAVKLDIQEGVNTETLIDDKLVSLTIKVPESLRQHWQIEAKRRRESVTQLIIQHLKAELGEP